MGLNLFQQITEVKWLGDMVICAIIKGDRLFAIVFTDCDDNNA
ncbi:MAG: hypothetical protein RMY29_008690 [Nostoc sp. CreGUA01]|nr:hypothetical protein [Nostoc sp. CreGUA01]